jgi:glutathione synthase/RimK-type ligase-like ATP-grasp enzyme
MVTVKAVRQIVFATYEGEPNLAADDRSLLPPLERLGFQVAPLRWDRDVVAPDCAGLVFRSCWNYDEAQGAFLRWLDELAVRGIPCCNPVALVRWNFHKRYLLDLEARGARLPPTVLLEQGDACTVEGLLARLGTGEAVVKPAISMLARYTFRLSSLRLEESERYLAQARSRGEVLVQSFVPEIQTRGESSLIFFGGEYSHAVRKRPAAGDFRSQSEHGGAVETISPSAAVRTQAERVLACLDEVPAIARVDGVEVSDELLLMELELIDPSLYLGENTAALDRCARVLAERLS